MLAAVLATSVLAAPPLDIPCPLQGNDAVTTISERDAQLGPLVLIGGLRHADRRPDAFGRKGYKIPVTLPAGMQATLVVPPSMRGRVGLVFRDVVQDRVWRRGVRAADTALRFTACRGGGRAGWPGGLVVDRPRCVTLVLQQDGQAPVRRRLPLGKPCR